MADPVSSDIALVDVRQEGGRLRGFITVPWFRYLVGSGPEGNGDANTVLHGNPGGSPTWAPVDLEADVVGVLQVANGGLGGLTGIVGGILYFSGLSAFSSTAAGTAHQVLHGGGAGSPTWGPVDVALETTGTLPLVRGGTGTTTGTGTGSVVLSNNANMSFPIISAATLQFGSATLSWQQQCPITYVAAASLGTLGHIQAGNSNVTSITNAGFVDLAAVPGPFFWLVHDKTSGGMALGFLDPVSGLSTITTTLAGIALAFDAITFRLRAQVTAGVSPRSISTFFVTLG